MESIEIPANAGDAARQEVIRRVLRAALEDCDGGSCTIAWMLKSCVELTVENLWNETSLKNFVPLLAMRGVKECITAGECPPRVVMA